jgi:hypothetical protein
MSILKKVIRAVKKMFQASVKPRRKPKSRPAKAAPKRKTVRPARSSSKKNKPVSRKARPALKTAKAKPAPAAPAKPAGTLVGEVTHYFDRIKVCVIRIDRDHVKKGDRLLIKGAKSELLQNVSSMQIENEDVTSARKGQLIGLKVAKEVFVKDQVYKAK